MPRSLNARLRRAVRVSTWLIAITVMALALVPLPRIPGLGHGDKLVHGIVFLVIALLSAVGWPRVRFAVLAAALVAFGAAIEVLQGLTGWRSAEWLDLAADAIGVIMGLGLARLIAGEPASAAP